jgi:hypothetical protein
LSEFPYKLRGDQNSIYLLGKEMNVMTKEKRGRALNKTVYSAIAHMSKSLLIYVMVDKIGHTMSQKHNM